MVVVVVTFRILLQIKLLVLIHKDLFPETAIEMPDALHYIFIVNKII